MRAWNIVPALVVLLCVTGAFAQPRPEINRDRIAPRAESITDTIDVCINSEVFHGAGHYFGTNSSGINIHVTSEGLKITEVARPPGGIESEPSASTETRYGPQIEALRAAAASNARVRLRHNDQYFVTQISIAYSQRCR